MILSNEQVQQLEMDGWTAEGIESIRRQVASGQSFEQVLAAVPPVPTTPEEWAASHEKVRAFTAQLDAGAK